jgi:dipeptidyl aminopeptidase/acylaminoacyl peptidase
LSQQEILDKKSELYINKFIYKKTRQVLRGIDSSVDFITLREGDSLITRTNKNELAKTYRSLANDAKQELDQLVTAYKIYQARPVQVAGEDGSPMYTGSGYFYYPYGYGTSYPNI